jgi:hypothetical protein
MCKIYRDGKVKAYKAQINNKVLLRTGTLPAAWSSLNLTGLNLDRNNLRGALLSTCTVSFLASAFV